MGSQQPPLTTEQPSELQQLAEGSELGKPFMQDGVDLTLLTLGEWKLLGSLQQEHERRIRKRAEELRFFPELGLSDQERAATVRCMTYEEIKPLKMCGAIYRKVERMMKELTFEEQVDVRILHNITIHFSEFGPKFKEMDDENIFVWTEIYTRMMRRHNLPLFEEPYSFLTREHKRSVLEAGSKLDPEEYMTEEELKALKGQREGEGAKRDNIVQEVACDG